MKEICIGKLKIGSGIPKICVPITGRTREEIKAQAAEIKNTKADTDPLRIKSKTKHKIYQVSI